ncbi:MAG: hypothetical protein KHX53_07310 [Bacteroides sp.]|nr:hypothetical protein [Bacteroides sp.]
MNNNTFENLLIADFYIRYQEKENKFEMSNLDKLFKKIKKEVYALEETLLIDDRDKKSENIKERLNEALMENGKLSDSVVYSLLHDDADWQQTINLLAQIIKQDGIISSKEKEVILKLSNKYSIDISKVKQLLKNKYTKKQKISIWTISVLSLLILAFCIGALVVNNIEKKKMSAFDIKKYVTQNPKLIFKTIKFSKFIVHGKPNGTERHLDKLNMFHIKGDADLYINMTNLHLDFLKTDYVRKELSLVYNSESLFPVSVDVNIPSSGYTQVEEIMPDTITTEEAEKVARPAAVVTGGVGGLIGGVLGSKIGKLFGPWGKWIGAGSGAAIGTTAGATAGYVYTKNFLAGLQLASNDWEDKENVIDASKALVALEIMGGNTLSEPDYDSKLQEYYQEECKKQITDIMKSFGWKEVNITFNYKKF